MRIPGLTVMFKSSGWGRPGCKFKGIRMGNILGLNLDSSNTDGEYTELNLH